MALWRNDAFVLFADVSIIGLLAKERRGAAEVNAHRQEDGDIEHTQKKYLKMTHGCDKIDLCYATAKILQRGGKNKITGERTKTQNCKKVADTSKK